MKGYEKLIGHTKTIIQHKIEVGKLCFKCGLYTAAILHDMSKFSPTEFIPGVKYYTGTKSPHYAERRYTGRSNAWMHHKAMNKHHAEYWHDISLESGSDVAIDIPDRYLLEMVCDRIGACKVYLKDKFTTIAPLKYYETHIDENEFSNKSRSNLVSLLRLYDELGEDEFCNRVKYCKGNIDLIIR